MSVYFFLQFFPQPSHSVADGKEYDGDNKRNVNGLVLDVAKMIADNYNDKHPSGWPQFAPTIDK